MRVYLVQFDNVAVSAAQDLFCLYSAAVTNGRMARLLRVVLSATDTTIPTSQMIQIQIKTFQLGTTTGVTAGSGGTVPTVQKIDNADAAATYTAHANDTTGVTQTAGNVQIVYDGGFHVYNGFDESFAVDAANPKGAQPLVVGVAAAGTLGSVAIAVRMNSVPTGTLHLSGSMWFEELG